MSNRDTDAGDSTISEGTLLDKKEKMWDYRNTLAERKQQAMRDGDEDAAAYHSGQMSGIIHAIEVLDGLTDRDDDE